MTYERNLSGSADALPPPDVAERAHRLLSDIPDNVAVVAAAKGATPEQVQAAVRAGIRIVGQNYITEARHIRPFLPNEVACHYIGRLRTHDLRASTVSLFDMLQTVDSLRLAQRLDAVCAASNTRVSVLIEVNSGHEPQKAGVSPEQAEALIRAIAELTHIDVKGLMTMGPFGASTAEYHACFGETRRLFERISRLDIRAVEMRHLSMGMSDSYQAAIEEGANMIRVGTILFGPRARVRAPTPEQS